ncbi:MAG: chloride channel protein [Lachnospiraceae bacterium]|nr:chloride channel protein [Lachnospiraceae bacterium]
MNGAIIRHKLKHNSERLLSVLKWTVLSPAIGALLGVFGAIFHHGIRLANAYREAHPWVLFLLPVGAVGIHLLYRVFHDEKDGGTNLVLSAIHAKDDIPLRMAPLIFLSTIFSHFVGASVGREGAALQFGGSIGNFFGKLFGFSETDKKTMIMVGMSGVFSALFGAPIAAAFFSMEVVSVGIMHYAALMPCVLASLVARTVAARLDTPAAGFDIGQIPAYTLSGGLKVLLLAVLCGLLSILFCLCLHRGGALASRFVPNRYVRALLFGSAVLALTLLAGDQTYNGAGVDYINACIRGEGRPLAFLIKILFTALSIIAGYRGGEIVPSFFIGASFGCIYGELMNFSPGFCAALGMGAVFCGVTNCPVTSFLICCELFGFEGAPYYLLALSFAYLLSGYYGLYTSQTIVYSKYKSNFINKETH